MPALLSQLAAEVVQLRVDSSSTRRRTGSPTAAPMPPCRRPSRSRSGAAAASAAEDPDARFAGRLLEAAVHDFLGVVDDEFLHSGAPPRDVLGRYADGHGVRGRPAT